MAWCVGFVGKQSLKMGCNSCVSGDVNCCIFSEHCLVRLIPLNQYIRTSVTLKYLFCCVEWSVIVSGGFVHV